MSDAARATLKAKLEALKDRFDEYARRQQACEEMDTEVSDRILTLELWKSDNGKGAERRISALEADMEAVKQITDAAIKTTIHETLDARERTVLARVRAWAPIISSAIGLAGMIVVAIIALHNPTPQTTVDVNVRPTHTMSAEPHR